MDAKTVAGKSLFFILICLFVAVFAQVFGQENSLTGVVVVVLALMMLGQDLSVRPMLNLGGLVAFTLLMGLGAYDSVSCGNAFVGAAINFTVVFALSYLTTQDLRSPMHFPFLLGYAFMLSVPVSAEDLPVRVLALVVGSVFIVALNVLINRNRHARTCHEGIASLCSEVSSCCETVLSGGSPSAESVDALCLRLRSSMYDRLRRSFFSTPGDRKVLDLASSLHMAGRAVCERERDPEVLRSLMSFMGTVASHERGECDVSAVREAADRFLSDHPGADGVLTASVLSLRDGLSSLASDQSPDSATDLRGRMRAMAFESFHTDSARFTFAVRMSVVFTLFAFVWQYWDLENAKWLLFTTVALVLPYVDNAWRKSAMRLTGTLVGVAAFAAVLALVGGDAGLLSAALLVANYVYTVLDPKRYDVMMVFITFSALIAASMASPAGDAVAERILFILLGVVAATLANYLVLPYRIRNEDVSMGGRYLALSDRMMSLVTDSLRGRRDPDGETVTSLTATGLSAKLHMNVEADPDADAGLFLAHQDSVLSQCSYLCGESEGLSDAGRRNALSMLGAGDAPDPSVLTDGDRTYASVLSATAETLESSRLLLARMVEARSSA